ncbi:hypothetical protein KCP69_00495 [Salmonella enterica subsp. enterica]|nr:hypothetical protein KCP69_00495 [Salmonella enterica subsp. enterica]
MRWARGFRASLSATRLKCTTGLALQRLRLRFWRGLTVAPSSETWQGKALVSANTDWRITSAWKNVHQQAGAVKG